MLIATTEQLHRRVGARGLDRQFGDQTLAFPSLSRAIKQPPAAEAPEAGQGDVFQHRKRWCHAVGAALFGDQRNAVAHCIAGRFQLQGLAIQQQLTALRFEQPEQAFQQLLGARTHQPGQADHFTTPHTQVDALIRVPCPQRIQLQHRCTGHTLSPGILLANVTVDHQPGDLRGAGERRINHRHIAPVAQHGDLVAERFYFLQIMRDVHNGQPFIAQTPHDGQ